MLMFVDMGRGLQKVDLFYVKSAICFKFSDKMCIFFKIFLHVNNVAPLNMF